MVGTISIRGYIKRLENYFSVLAVAVLPSSSSLAVVERSSSGSSELSLTFLNQIRTPKILAGNRSSYSYVRN